MSDVTITIGVDNRGAITGIEEIGRSTDNAGKKAQGLGGHLQDVAKIAGGFVVAQGLSKMAGFLGDAAKGAAEDAAATARLEQALRNAGGAFDENLAKVNERISAGAKLAFSDDQVRDSFQQLLAATGDTSEALNRQKVAMDLARGAGISLEQASKMVSKVNEENVDAFKRLGITIADGATEAEALAAVQAKYAGQAETYASTTAGQFEASKIAIGEAKEALGAALLPAMAAVSAIVAEKLVPAMTKATEVMSENPEITKAAAAVIGGVLVAAFSAWAVSAAAAAAATILAAAPVLAVVAAVALLAAGIYLLVTRWDDITAKYPVLGQISDAVKEKLQAFGGWITGTFVPAVMALANTIGDAGAKAVGFVQQHWGTIEAILKPYVAAWQAVFKAAFDAIQLYFETVFGVLSGIFEVFMGVFTGDWERAWNGVKDIFGTIWNGLKELAQIGLDLVKELTPIATQIGKDVLQGMQDGISALFTEVIWPWFQALPGEIKSAIGDVSRLLWDVGKSMIQGLIDGMKSIPIPNPVDMIPGSGIVKGAVGGARDLFPQLMAPDVSEPFIASPTGAYGNALTNIGGQWFEPNAIGNYTSPGVLSRPAPIMLTATIVMPDGKVLAEVVTNELGRSM